MASSLRIFNYEHQSRQILTVPDNVIVSVVTAVFGVIQFTNGSLC